MHTLNVPLDPSHPFLISKYATVRGSGRIAFRLHGSAPDYLLVDVVWRQHFALRRLQLCSVVYTRRATIADRALYGLYPLLLHLPGTSHQRMCISLPHRCKCSGAA